MAKLQHKKVWNWWHQHLGVTLKQHGYTPHPVYLPGWDPYNQSYEAEFTLGLQPDGLRQLRVYYISSARQLGLIATHYWCREASERFASITEPGDWTTATQALPWHRVGVRDNLRGWTLLSYTNRVKFSRAGVPSNLDKIWRTHQQPLQGLLQQIKAPVPAPEGFSPPRYNPPRLSQKTEPDNTPDWVHEQRRLPREIASQRIGGGGGRGGRLLAPAP